MDFPLFPIDTFPNEEKNFSFFEKNISEAFGKVPLQVEVSLYMLMKNGDRQLLGECI